MGPEPKFYISLPEDTPKGEKNIPVVSGRVPITIRLDEKVKRYVTEQRYEIIFFVDFHFVSEMEEGHSPFNLMWNTQKIPNGEHLITVNVATLSGQISSASTRLIVMNER